MARRTKTFQKKKIKTNQENTKASSEIKKKIKTQTSKSLVTREKGMEIFWENLFNYPAVLSIQFSPQIGIAMTDGSC